MACRGAEPAPAVLAPSVATTVAPIALPEPPDAGRDRSGDKAAADAATATLATKLAAVDAACRATWDDERRACGDPEFASLAKDYQGYYADFEDPTVHDGRIDALPRLGGKGRTVDGVSAAIARACEERCELARRTAIAEAKEIAIETCTTNAKAHAACKELQKRMAPTAPKAVTESVASCDDQCDARRREMAAHAAWLKSRPHTLAESHVCFRDCMTKCTGGRIVPDANGNFTRPADDWCGTCEMSCRYDCAVRP